MQRSNFSPGSSATAPIAPGSADAPDWLLSAEGALRGHTVPLVDIAPPATGSPCATVTSVATTKAIEVKGIEREHHNVAQTAAVLELRQREGELLRTIESLELKLSRQQRETEELLSLSRQKDMSLETMLREVTRTMQAEIGRSERLQIAYEEEIKAAKATAAKLESQLNEARHSAVSHGASRSEPSTTCADIVEQIAQQLAALPLSLSTALHVEEVLREHAGDVCCAAPPLLLSALKQSCTLHEQNEQLNAASEAVMAAQADAVRKLAASAGAGPGVVGSAVSYLRGVRKFEPGVASELLKKDAEIAKLREALSADGRLECIGAVTGSPSAILGVQPADSLSLPGVRPAPVPALAPGAGNIVDHPSKAVAVSRNDLPLTASVASFVVAAPDGSVGENGLHDVPSAERQAPLSSVASPRCSSADVALSPTSARSAKAVKYVDTLLGRANRDKIPEEDARQALEYFEAAKQSNASEDYKSACSYFETSFLLNPKLTTLISTANM